MRRGGRHGVVRDWKMVAESSGLWELYNLARAQTGRVKAMAAQYEAWMNRCQVEPWELVAESGGPWELYNLAGTQAGRVKEMAARYEAWMKRCQVEPWETVRPRR